MIRLRTTRGKLPNRIMLEELHQRHRGLTPSIAGSYREAASVCLSRSHTPPVQITTSDNGFESDAELAWAVPDSDVLGAWANATDATEAGAYGCVIAGVELLRNLFAIRRAETGTGADYYVGPTGSGQHDLEDCLRLEVSGVGSGDRRDVTTRLLAKVRQAQQGESSLPAMAGVIGFAARLLMVRDVGESS